MEQKTIEILVRVVFQVPNDEIGKGQAEHVYLHIPKGAISLHLHERKLDATIQEYETMDYSWKYD